MDRAARLKKRGSLQGSQRHTISKASGNGDRLFSVPNFLQLTPNPHSSPGYSSGGGGKRGSVIVYGNRNNKKSIRAGNLEGLVELLTADEADTQPSYVETFVATHTYFVDSQSLMTRLMERFYDGDDERVINVFKKWMTFYFEDFTEENFIFFNMFLSDLGSRGFEVHASELRAVYTQQEQIYQRRLARDEVELASTEASTEDSTNSILQRIPDLDDASHDPSEIARQMTLVEERQYKEISLREFLQLAWSKKDGELKARKLNRLIQRFNAVSFWAATAILTCDHSSKKRGKMLALFIQVADACLQLQNYQSAMQLYSALNMTPVERLEKEWAGLPKKVLQMYENLKGFFESSGNFKCYREKLSQVNAPAIPVLSFILSDLTMIEENNTSIKIKVEDTSSPSPSSSPSTSTDGPASSGGEESELVHFEKMSMIFNSLSQLKRCGKVSYSHTFEHGGGISISSEALTSELSHSNGGGGKKTPRAKEAKEEAALVRMLTDLPRLSEKELYDLKNDTKKKVKDLRKALKAAKTAASKKK